MGYKMGNASRLRVNNHLAWQARVIRSITRHHGVLKRVSQDLDVGYSTLKRWIADEESFQKAIQVARGNVESERSVFARRIRRPSVA